MKEKNFTEGRILPQLLRFMLPVLFAMFLQSMYGAVDLLVVGRFAENAEVSGVATGSQVIQTLTNLIVSFSMGITVAVAQRIGERRPETAARTVGTGLLLFVAVGAAFTLIGVLCARPLAAVMHAPPEAFDVTVNYIRITGGGFFVITAYNLLGSIFRGLGDSGTPLLAVAIACACNIAGDLLFVAVFRLGAAGAAIATVAAQFVSVAVSLGIIVARRAKLPFSFGRAEIRVDRPAARAIFRIGTPIAMQEFLVGVSFLVLTAIVNGMGVDASAGVGVAQKVCAFIMLVPGAFMQSMSAFVGQNVGAGKPDRARLALRWGVLVSFAFGVAMFLFTFFRGDLLAGIFSQDAAAVAAAFEYLKSYAIDCLFTCFLFCFIGYYNGVGKTAFCMVQGLVGAFCVRVPVAFVMQQVGGGSLFLIGLATPCSTVVQIAICFAAYAIYRRRERAAEARFRDPEKSK